MEIIIGRDEKTSRLKVCVGQQFKLYGAPGSVPMSVSRQHCSIDYTEGGSFVIHNVKTGKNVTMVNGNNIETKRATLDDIIQLGFEKYILDLKSIVKDLPSPPPSVCIVPLEQVWNEYHDRKINLQIKERKMNAVRSVTGIFTLSAVACTLIPGVGDIGFLRILLYIVAIVLTIAFFVITYRSASQMPAIQEEIDNEFHDKYVCPNEKCGHFLGYQKYRDLSQMDKCPYCGAKFKNR